MALNQTRVRGSLWLTGVDPVISARRVHYQHQLSIPVRPERLAFEIGIPVISAPFSDNLSGLLVPETIGNEVRYVIFVNSKHRLTRRRFSVAHELGHFYLHRGLRLAFTHHSRHRGRLEREADRFAAELLMPEKYVRELSKQIDFEEMVRRFEVSAAAMRRRLNELGVKI